MKRIILISLSFIAVLFPILMLTYSTIFSEKEGGGEIGVDSITLKKVICSNIKSTDFKSIINFSGKVVSANKIPISSEVNGVFLNSNENKFKVGQKFKKGDILIKLDCSDLEFQLKSSKIEFKQLLLQVLPDLKSDFPSSYDEWLKYVNEFQMEGSLLQHPSAENEKQSNFLASRGVLSSFVQLQRVQNQLDKSIIKAPFDGVVTQSFLSSGMNIIPYQKLGEFMDDSNFEIVTSFSLDDSNFLDIGDKAIIYSDGNYGSIKEDFIIELIRMGTYVNPLTQGVDVIFKVNNPYLLDGMFVNGSIEIKKEIKVSKIHKEKIIDKKYVFINLNNKIKKKEVSVIFSENDSIIITGLNEKDCLIDKYQNHFFDGMGIE